MPGIIHFNVALARSNKNYWCPIKISIEQHRESG